MWRAFLAALALAHLLGPESEARGEVYSCAYNKLQAALIFAEMKAIVQAVPAFATRELPDDIAAAPARTSARREPAAAFDRYGMTRRDHRRTCFGTRRMPDASPPRARR